MDDPVALVERAVELFSAGEDEQFVALFAPDMVIWAIPELAGGDVVFRGRADLEKWIEVARQQWSDVRFGRGDLFEHGAGVYLELDVFTESTGGGGGWRLPVAIFVRDGQVVEVVPQPDRASAMQALEAR